MALKIYGVLRSRATRNVWLARELGLTFEHVPVIQGYRLPDPLAPDAPLNTTSPAFLAINPNGQIPCMDEDGFVLTESMAINLYLARRHGGPLGPANLQEEALMMSWSFWAVSQCETHALDILYNRVGRPPQERNEAAAEAAEVALRRPFRVLEQALSMGGGHPVGGRFTVADINIAEVLRYAQASSVLFESHPAVKEWLARCQARPVFTQMMAERNAEPV